jgi:hypothetical protein
MVFKTEDVRQEKAEIEKKDTKTSFGLLRLCLSSFVFNLISYKLNFSSLSINLKLANLILPFSFVFVQNYFPQPYGTRG